MAKNIWQEIKEQPPHIRETFMWLCVIVSFSLVGYAWFSSTAKQFVALVNPEEARQAQAVAKSNSPSQSPFASIGLTLKDLGASIWQLIDFTKKTNNFEIKNNPATQETGQSSELIPVPLQKLPLSGNKKQGR